MLVIVKTKIAAKLAVVALPLALAAYSPSAPASRGAEVIAVPAGTMTYRLPGDFNRAGRPVDGPLAETRLDHRVLMMRHQVTAADYAACVKAGACPDLGEDGPPRADVPVVGVSYVDAGAYAAWYSRMTGETWRLPTDLEWARAAGSRFGDDAVTADDGTSGFEKRWIARYEQESARLAGDRAAQPLGTFGLNEHGLADLGGNVWEWTTTCFERRDLEAGRGTINCGVRVVEGRHRSYMTDFIRDARSGGCAVGVPPANLGFRLVREERGLLPQLVARLF